MMALHFAVSNASETELPVVFEIIFKGPIGLFDLTDEFTAFPEEQEVLIQDGL